MGYFPFVESRRAWEMEYWRKFQPDLVVLTKPVLKSCLLLTFGHLERLKCGDFAFALEQPLEQLVEWP